MTKKEIEQRIIESNYASKNVVIWWRDDDCPYVAIYRGYGYDEFLIIGFETDYSFEELVDFIWRDSDAKNFKFRILEIE